MMRFVVQTISMSDGCRINYRFDGDEKLPALLLSNSLSSTFEMWAPQMPALTEHFRVLRYDPRGHGESGVGSTPCTIERLGMDARELIEQLGVGPLTFCGLSMGGMVGMWLAANAPGLFTKAVFANTSAYFGMPDVWNQRIEAVRASGSMQVAAETTIQRWLTQEFMDANPEIRDQVFAMIAGSPVEGYLTVAAAVRDVDLRESLPDIEIPALVIAGALDPSTPPAMSEVIVEAIPNARLAILDSAHLSNVEKADEFNSLVISFLAPE